MKCRYDVGRELDFEDGTLSGREVGEMVLGKKNGCYLSD